LPEAYIAPRELRDLRDLLRHRVALTQVRSALKNRVHALLARHGILHGYSDLFGQAGNEFLAALELRDPPRRRLGSLLALIGDFDREIEAATGEVDALAKHDDRVEVLCQLRGIGRYTAMLVIAEVGDIARFDSARKLCAWAGLTPTVRSSDGKARLGHITKQGSRPLRWALVEAAQHAGRGAARSATASNGSPSAAAARSPRSRSRASCSRSATTACAMEKSVAWRAAADRARRYSWRPPHESRRPPDRRRRHRTRSGFSGELAQSHGLHQHKRTAAVLIEPPSTARHPGPPRVAGWMTGTPPQRRPPGRPTTRGP
jgi:hypothetical protein